MNIRMRVTLIAFAIAAASFFASCAGNPAGRSAVPVPAPYPWPEYFPLKTLLEEEVPVRPLFTYEIGGGRSGELEGLKFITGFYSLSADRSALKKIPHSTGSAQSQDLVFSIRRAEGGGASAAFVPPLILPSTLDLTALIGSGAALANAADMAPCSIAGQAAAYAVDGRVFPQVRFPKAGPSPAYTCAAPADYALKDTVPDDYPALEEGKKLAGRLANLELIRERYRKDAAAQVPGASARAAEAVEALYLACFSRATTDLELMAVQDRVGRDTTYLNWLIEEAPAYLRITDRITGLAVLQVFMGYVGLPNIVVAGYVDRDGDGTLTTAERAVWLRWYDGSGGPHDIMTGRYGARPILRPFDTDLDILNLASLPSVPKTAFRVPEGDETESSIEARFLTIQEYTRYEKGAWKVPEMLRASVLNEGANRPAAGAAPAYPVGGLPSDAERGGEYRLVPFSRNFLPTRASVYVDGRVFVAIPADSVIEAVWSRASASRPLDPSPYGGGGGSLATAPFQADPLSRLPRSLREEIAAIKRTNSLDTKRLVSLASLIGSFALSKATYAEKTSPYLLEAEKPMEKRGAFLDALIDSSTYLKNSTTFGPDFMAAALVLCLQEAGIPSRLVLGSSPVGPLWAEALVDGGSPRARWHRFVALPPGAGGKRAKESSGGTAGGPDGTSFFDLGPAGAEEGGGGAEERSDGSPEIIPWLFPGGEYRGSHTPRAAEDQRIRSSPEGSGGFSAEFSGFTRFYLQGDQGSELRSRLAYGQIGIFNKFDSSRWSYDESCPEPSDGFADRGGPGSTILAETRVLALSDPAGGYATSVPLILPQLLEYQATLLPEECENLQDIQVEKRFGRFLAVSYSLIDPSRPGLVRYRLDKLRPTDAQLEGDDEARMRAVCCAPTGFDAERLDSETKNQKNWTTQAGTKIRFSDYLAQLRSLAEVAARDYEALASGNDPEARAKAARKRDYAYKGIAEALAWMLINNVTYPGAGDPGSYDRAHEMFSKRWPLRAADGSELPPERQVDLANFLLSQPPESRVGDCDIGNTVYIELLRYLGIPARLATGHAAFRDNRGDVITFSTGNGHGWAQVWLNGRWNTYDATPWSLIEYPALPPTFALRRARDYRSFIDLAKRKDLLAEPIAADPAANLLSDLRASYPERADELLDALFSYALRHPPEAPRALLESSAVAYLDAFYGFAQDNPGLIDPDTPQAEIDEAVRNGMRERLRGLDRLRLPEYCVILAATSVSDGVPEKTREMVDAVALAFSKLSGDARIADIEAPLLRSSLGSLTYTLWAPDGVLRDAFPKMLDAWKAAYKDGAEYPAPSGNGTPAELRFAASLARRLRGRDSPSASIFEKLDGAEGDLRCGWLRTLLSLDALDVQPAEEADVRLLFEEIGTEAMELPFNPDPEGKRPSYDTCVLDKRNALERLLARLRKEDGSLSLDDALRISRVAANTEWNVAFKNSFDKDATLNALREGLLKGTRRSSDEEATIAGSGADLALFPLLLTWLAETERSPDGAVEMAAAYGPALMATAVAGGPWEGSILIDCMDALFRAKALLARSPRDLPAVAKWNEAFARLADATLKELASRRNAPAFDPRAGIYAYVAFLSFPFPIGARGEAETAGVAAALEAERMRVSLFLLSEWSDSFTGAARYWSERRIDSYDRDGAIGRKLGEIGLDGTRRAEQAAAVIDPGILRDGSALAQARFFMSSWSDPQGPYTALNQSASPADGAADGEAALDFLDWFIGILFGGWQGYGTALKEAGERDEARQLDSALLQFAAQAHYLKNPSFGGVLCAIDDARKGSAEAGSMDFLRGLERRILEFTVFPERPLFAVSDPEPRTYWLRKKADLDGGDVGIAHRGYEIAKDFYVREIDDDFSSALRFIPSILAFGKEAHGDAGTWIGGCDREAPAATPKSFVACAALYYSPGSEPASYYALNGIILSYLEQRKAGTAAPGNWLIRKAGSSADWDFAETDPSFVEHARADPAGLFMPKTGVDRLPKLMDEVLAAAGSAESLGFKMYAYYAMLSFDAIASRPATYTNAALSARIHAAAARLRTGRRDLLYYFESFFSFDRAASTRFAELNRLVLEGNIGRPLRFSIAWNLLTAGSAELNPVLQSQTGSAGTIADVLGRISRIEYRNNLGSAEIKAKLTRLQRLFSVGSTAVGGQRAEAILDASY